MADKAVVLVSSAGGGCYSACNFSSDSFSMIFAGDLWLTHDSEIASEGEMQPKQLMTMQSGYLLRARLV